MTRKDYVKIADVLGDHRPHQCDDGYFSDIVVGFCAMLKEDNPSFNEDKFKDRINNNEY